MSVKVIALLFLGFFALATPTPGAAQAINCLQGYVWRAASPQDVVCVTPQSRALVSQENSLANSRRESGPRGGIYYCLQGYVWREAFPGDHVCVIPAARDRVARENTKAAKRRVGGGSEFNTIGTHTLEIGVVDGRYASQEKTFRDGCTRGDMPFPGPLTNMVGWGQTEHSNAYNCQAFVMERAVAFDRTLLDRVPNKQIKKVILTYDETAAQNCTFLVAGETHTCWQSGNHHPENKPNGCAVVRTPTVDWVRDGGAYAGLLPAVEGSQHGIKRVNARTWDVTKQISWQLDQSTMPLVPPGGIVPKRGHGLLLGGGPALSQLTAQDNTICISELQNIALEVSYEVIDPGVFRPPH